MELLSEEEQAEALKAWLRRNGPLIVGAVLLALALNFGIGWWKDRGQKRAELAGGSYERILQTFDAGKLDEALAQIEALRGEYPKSPYVAASDLAAARVFVMRNELDKAELRLERVSGYMNDPQMKPLVTQRLARVQSGLGRNDEALATLGTTNQGAYEPLFAEARGDVLFAKGDLPGALREYEAARNALPSGNAEAGVGRVLDLKINDLRTQVATP